MSARTRLERDAAIVTLAARGVSRKAIAARYDLTEPRICMILSAARTECDCRDQIRAADEREGRRDRFLELYEAGFSIAEIAKTAGVSGPRIARILNGHPGYEARCPHPRYGRKAEVPAWVPARHAARYQRIAASDGEEVAAGCIRRMKALEARA